MSHGKIQQESVHIQSALYDALKAHCDTNEQTVSATVDRWVNEDLDQREAAEPAPDLPPGNPYMVGSVLFL